MNIIAHRGLYNKKYGENTISAFDNAFNNDYLGIELDVHKTKDNEIVIIHDSFISRTSDGIGHVGDLTYNELLKYNFGKERVERIPLLKEVVNRYHNKVIMIELKEKINIEELNLNNQNDYYISSFHYDFITNIPKSSKYKKGIINYVFNSNIDLDKIDFIMILDDLITDAIYNFFANHGIEVIIYGVIGKPNNKISTEIRQKVKYVL